MGEASIQKWMIFLVAEQVLSKICSCLKTMDILRLKTFLCYLGQSCPFRHPKMTGLSTKYCTNEVDMSLAGLIAQKDPQWDRQ